MSDDGGRHAPNVPADRLTDWRCTDRSTETVFELATASIEGHTVVYEDRALREAVATATDGALDLTWRFFFATGLVFSPPLPPGIGPMAVFSTVASEANRKFGDDLRTRGFRNVTKGRRERVRVASGDRARLHRFDAVLDIEGALADGHSLEDGAGAPCDRELDVTGLLAVWTTDGKFRLAGGAYPTAPLDQWLGIELAGVETDPSVFRDDLLELVRNVR